MAAHCILNAQDCSLGLQLLQLPEGGETATPPAHGACGFAWHGARGTIGVYGGRHRFSVRLLQNVQPESTVVQQHAEFHELSAIPGVRIGISCVSTDVAMLGESTTSWAFASTGRKSGGGGGFLPFGTPFGIGDEVHVCVDLTGPVGLVSFAVNDRWCGEAFRLPRPGTELRVFPHILVKNTAVRVTFGGDGQLEGPVGSFRPWQFAANVPQHFCLSPALAAKQDRYEVLLLIGMPGSGKSQYAEKYIRGNHGYTLLGVNAALDQMRVRGVCRQREQVGRVGPLLRLGEQLFEAQLKWATQNPRNYLIDQPSVHEEGVCKRVAAFPRPAFRRLAALIVLPDKELFRRQAEQHARQGKTVAEEVILGMRASFFIPRPGPVFDDVIFLEVQPPHAQAMVAEMQAKARAGLQELMSRKRQAAQHPQHEPPGQRPRFDAPPGTGGRALNPAAAPWHAAGDHSLPPGQRPDLAGGRPPLGSPQQARPGGMPFMPATSEEPFSMGQPRYRPQPQQPHHSQSQPGASPRGGQPGPPPGIPAACFQPATSEEPFSMGEPRYRPQPQQPHHSQPYHSQAPQPVVSPRAAPPQQARFQAATGEEPFSMGQREFRSPAHQGQPSSHQGQPPHRSQQHQGQQQQQQPPVASPGGTPVVSPRGPPAARFQPATSQEPFSIDAPGRQMPVGGHGRAALPADAHGRRAGIGAPRELDQLQQLQQQHGGSPRQQPPQHQGEPGSHSQQQTGAAPPAGDPGGAPAAGSQQAAEQGTQPAQPAKRRYVTNRDWAPQPFPDDDSGPAAQHAAGGQSGGQAGGQAAKQPQPSAKQQGWQQKQAPQQQPNPQQGPRRGGAQPPQQRQQQQPPRQQQAHQQAVQQGVQAAQEVAPQRPQQQQQQQQAWPQQFPPQQANGGSKAPEQAAGQYTSAQQPPYPGAGAANRVAASSSQPHPAANAEQPSAAQGQAAAAEPPAWGQPATPDANAQSSGVWGQPQAKLPADTAAGQHTPSQQPQQTQPQGWQGCQQAASGHSGDAAQPTGGGNAQGWQQQQQQEAVPNGAGQGTAAGAGAWQAQAPQDGRLPQHPQQPHQLQQAQQQLQTAVPRQQQQQPQQQASAQQSPAPEQAPPTPQWDPATGMWYLTQPAASQQATASGSTLASPHAAQDAGQAQPNAVAAAQPMPQGSAAQQAGYAAAAQQAGYASAAQQAPQPQAIPPQASPGAYAPPQQAWWQQHGGPQAAPLQAAAPQQHQTLQQPNQQQGGAQQQEEEQQQPQQEAPPPPPLPEEPPPTSAPANSSAGVIAAALQLQRTSGQLSGSLQSPHIHQATPAHGQAPARSPVYGQRQTPPAGTPIGNADASANTAWAQYTAQAQCGAMPQAPAASSAWPAAPQQAAQNASQLQLQPPAQQYSQQQLQGQPAYGQQQAQQPPQHQWPGFATPQQQAGYAAAQQPSAYPAAGQQLAGAAPGVPVYQQHQANAAAAVPAASAPSVHTHYAQQAVASGQAGALPSSAAAGALPTWQQTAQFPPAAPPAAGQPHAPRPPPLPMPGQQQQPAAQPGYAAQGQGAQQVAPGQQPAAQQGYYAQGYYGAQPLQQLPQGAQQPAGQHQQQAGQSQYQQQAKQPQYQQPVAPPQPPAPPQYAQGLGSLAIAQGQVQAAAAAGATQPAAAQQAAAAGSYVTSNWGGASGTQQPTGLPSTSAALAGPSTKPSSCAAPAAAAPAAAVAAAAIPAAASAAYMGQARPPPPAMMQAPGGGVPQAYGVQQQYAAMGQPRPPAYWQQGVPQPPQGYAPHMPQPQQAPPRPAPGQFPNPQAGRHGQWRR